jgi:small GTP-binding protein
VTFSTLPNRVERLTAAGTSALAVVRLDGPDAHSLIQRFFSKPLRPMRPVHGELRDESGVIDDPVVLLASDGSIELTLHASKWIVDSVCAWAGRHGFESGSGQPSTVEATIEAEIEAALPLVKTELAARVLLAQRDAWRDTHWSPELAREVLNDGSLAALLNPPSVAIVGLPNAGKSTLANRLFGQQRSIVSPIAGTTRDWVGEQANLDGLVVTLIDTPGIRTSSDAIEQHAIRLSLQTIKAADLVLVLLDATQDERLQRELIDRHPGALVVMNKLDLADRFNDDPTTTGDNLCVSATLGTGIETLIERLKASFGVGVRPDGAVRWFTQRQRSLLESVAGRGAV